MVCLPNLSESISTAVYIFAIFCILATSSKRVYCTSFSGIRPDRTTPVERKRVLGRYIFIKPSFNGSKSSAVYAVGRVNLISIPMSLKSCLLKNRISLDAASLYLLAFMQAFSRFLNSWAKIKVSLLDGGVNVFVLLMD